MKKIAFIPPWFGWNIPGGAETEMRGIVQHMAASGVEVEILTTCAEKFASDWSKNYYKPGTVHENGVTIRRFKVNGRRDSAAFDRVNALLIAGKLPLTDAEEEIFLRESINSPQLYEYLAQHEAEYEAFFFIPYIFGTTYYGARAVLQKAILIPCFHDEAYIYLRIWKDVFEHVRGMIHLAEPERDLANRVFDLSQVKSEALGAGVDTELFGDAQQLRTGAERFREKFGITQPFILYAGRKEKGKNIDSLLAMFARYKQEQRRSQELISSKAEDKTYNQSSEESLQLVLLGGGSVEIPAEIAGDVKDLGFVDLQDKLDAYAAAQMLCQPSKNESFSIVIMESWLAGRPVLVHKGCHVTADFAVQSNGGFYFDSYAEWAGEVDYLLQHPDIAKQMGENGRNYVLTHFAWDVIVKKYLAFIE